ncbi:hypothetical protein LEP1GSC188_1506 [Leptospira weilii serovar Topaz str. LT2116]|uniref:Uncharacterized protein n=1 Tax=Leptospira weilii serovar Topaz str. LT2116 TaxID=1088540 RepID=M3FGY2_9LEPT|nr:hypothetical protein LEP1GSC188_1506 [Leptospira weilii serovar Topaz str. LT2116]
MYQLSPRKRKIKQVNFRVNSASWTFGTFAMVVHTVCLVTIFSIIFCG